MKALGNPADDHSGPGGKYRTELPAEPAEIADRGRLRGSSYRGHHLAIAVTIWLASLEARAWARLGNGAVSREAIACTSDLREQLARNDPDESATIGFALPLDQ